MKKSLWPNLSGYLQHEKRQGTLYNGPQGFLVFFCANDKIFSLGPERSTESNISKNSCFHDDNFFGPLFFRYSSVTNIGEQFRRIHMLFWQLLLNLWEHFFRDLRGCCKQKVLKKRQTFHWKKHFGHFFCTIEHEKCQETKYKGPQCILTFIEQLIRTFLGGPKRSIETNVSKNSLFLDDECFWPMLLRIIESHKHHGRNYKGPKTVLPFTLQLIRAFFRT